MPCQFCKWRKTINHEHAVQKAAFQVVDTRETKCKCQLDSALIDARMRKDVQDIEACDLITTGTDHRPLMWKYVIPQHARRKRTTKRSAKHVQIVGWKPESLEIYENQTDEKMKDLEM